MLDRNLFTRVAHDPHDVRHQGAVTFPIYQNSLFTLGGSKAPNHPYSYSRGANPTVEELEKRLAALEGGEEARCFASGMSAISSAILSTVRAGDHIVCVNQAYPGTRALLEHYVPRFGVSVTFVDGSSLQAIESAIAANTKLLYLESPTSFFFELQNIAACATLAKERGLRTILDNSCATSCFQQPIALGVDMVVHSLSKYVGGHSDALGGAVIGTKGDIERISADERTLLGGVMSPHTASLMLRGLRTLPLRVERYDQTARVVAEYLNTLPFLAKVNYPGLADGPQSELARSQMSGFGGLMSFEWDASRETVQAWVEQLTYFRNGCSWGGYESLAIVLGSLEGLGKQGSNILIRLYTGMEDPEELTGDLAQAFAAVAVRA